jgi:hypothetical protein
MNTHIWLSRLISGLISVLQAAALRNRLYTALNRIEILETAMEDIERINANSANPNALISGIVVNCGIDRES